LIAASGIDLCSSRAVLGGDKRCKWFQTLEKAVDTVRRWIGIEKPISAAFCPRSPKHTRERRNVKVLGDAIAYHRDMRELINELGTADSALFVFQIIRVEFRRRLGNAC
jgi:hypothetical protein